MDELLEEFPVVITVPILWGDMDAMQHVNNTVYLKHFEHDRMAYFDRIQIDQVSKSTGIGPILAETTCRFRIPLTYPDQVSIGTRVTEVGDDRLTMEHRVVSHNHQKIAADGNGRIVAFDYHSGRKSRFTEAFKQAIASLEQRTPSI